MSKDWKQARICVEKILPKDQQRVRSMSRDSRSAQKLRAAFVTEKIWPLDSKIRIGFMYDDDRAVQWTSIATLKQHSHGKPLDPITTEIMKMSPEQAVRTVVRERIIPIVGLDIDFVDDPNQANVRVTFNDSGAWAYVGIDHLSYKYPEPTVNFGWLDAGTIMHEFGHVLGMIHEHQNPHGENIKWDKSIVYNWAAETQGWDHTTTETNILDRYNLNYINGSDFDPLSIMLYFFPANLTTNDEGTYMNLRLSGYDVLWINKMYEKNAPLSADQFYEKTYKESLDKAIKDSNEARKDFGNHKSRNLFSFIPKSVWISLAILIFGAIMWFSLKKRRRYKR